MWNKAFKKIKTSLQIFKGCTPQVLLSPFLNTLFYQFANSTLIKIFTCLWQSGIYLNLKKNLANVSRNKYFASIPLKMKTRIGYLSNVPRMNRIIFKWLTHEILIFSPSFAVVFLWSLLVKLQQETYQKALNKRYKAKDNFAILISSPPNHSIRLLFTNICKMRVLIT